jgi:predicted nucleic acid-binding protein
MAGLFEIGVQGWHSLTSRAAHSSRAFRTCIDIPHRTAFTIIHHKERAYNRNNARVAIQLAVQLQQSRVLIDDASGRTEAESRGLLVTGTRGVLAEAHRASLLDFNSAIPRLAATSVYITPRVPDLARRLL